MLRKHLFIKFIPKCVYIIAIGITIICWQAFTNRQVIPQSAALLISFLGLVDWLMVANLPRLGLSYGSVSYTWVFVLLGRILLVLFVILPLGLILWLFPGIHATKVVNGAWVFWVMINLLATLIEYYSMYIEPFDLKLTQIRIPGPTYFSDRSLRILQISDIHIERLTKREHKILENTHELHPDIIVLTGDYLNYDYTCDGRARQEAHTFLSQLHAPYGVYAIPGSPSVDTPEVMDSLFHDLDIKILINQAQLLSIGSGKLNLIGVKIDRSGGDHTVLSQLMGNTPPEAFPLLLYHSPDLIETAAKNGVLLYLAGHTHGGQIRFPFIGALITLSVYGRKYASGMHRLGPTTLYTSRGLGLEGLHLPRARFLCPPEMVFIELGVWE